MSQLFGELDVRFLYLPTWIFQGSLLTRRMRRNASMALRRSYVGVQADAEIGPEFSARSRGRDAIGAAR